MKEFSPSAAIQAGWETFKKRPWLFVGVTILVFFVSGSISAAFGSHKNSELERGLMSIANLLVQTLVDIGLVSFALKAVSNIETVRVSDLWHPQMYFQYLAAIVLTGLCVVVGLILFIIPGIIAILMLAFVKYALVAHKLGPVEAMKRSAHITKGHRLNILVFLVLLLIINVVGAVCLFVGLLVSIPVTYLAMVHAYRMLEKGAGHVA